MLQVFVLLSLICTLVAADLKTTYLDVSIARPHSLTLDSTNYLYVLGQNLAIYDNFQQLTATINLTGIVTSPQSVTVDQDGDIYIADLDGARIAVLNSDGVYLRSLDGLGQTQLSPTGVAIDQLGRVVVANRAMQTITILDSRNGSLITEFDSSSTSPLAVAVDTHNRIYELDNTTNRVLVYTAAGVLQSVWNVVGLNSPSALTIDSSNNVYVSNTLDNNILVFNLQGDVLTSALSSLVIPHPTGIVVSSSGQLFIVEEGRIMIVIGISLPGSLLRQVTGSFSNPQSVVVNSEGLIYVPDPAGQVQVYGSADAPVASYPNSSSITLFQPWGVALSTDANLLFVVDRAGNKIVGFDVATGAVNLTLTSSELRSPNGVAVHPKTQEIYVTDDYLSLIVVFSGQGEYIRSVSVDGMKSPSGIAIGFDGSVYIADSMSNRIMILNRMNKLVNTLTGFDFPCGVVVDAHKNVYVADANNNAVVVVNSQSQQVFRFAGLNSPRGVQLDANNRIYVADAGANRIIVLQGI